MPLATVSQIFSTVQVTIPAPGDFGNIQPNSSISIVLHPVDVFRVADVVGGRTVEFRLVGDVDGLIRLNPTDNGDGTYSYVYGTTAAQNFALIISVDGKIISTQNAPSPFTFTVIPGAIDPAQSIAILSPQSCYVGDVVKVTVTAFDFWGNRVRRGGANIAVDFLVDPCGELTSQVDNGDGTYIAAFHVSVPFLMPIFTVKINGITMTNQHNTLSLSTSVRPTLPARISVVPTSSTIITAVSDPNTIQSLFGIFGYAYLAGGTQPFPAEVQVNLKLRNTVTGTVEAVSKVVQPASTGFYSVVFIYGYFFVPYTIVDSVTVSNSSIYVAQSGGIANLLPSGNSSSVMSGSVLQVPNVYFKLNPFLPGAS